MNNFDDVLAKSFFEMMEKCYDSLEKDSWQSFCTELRDGLNNIGLRIMKQMLEQVNLAFKDDQSLRPEWVVERNGDLKSILTVFGKLEYQRTYYRHKRTGRCAYLADMFAGYTAHQKLDPLLETQLVEHASEMSYAKAGKQAECHAKDTVVTDTTVMNVIRKLNPERYENIPRENKKRICSRLYIEADEDHVADQQRGSKRNNKFEQKLVYVHEGRKSLSKDRNKQKNVHYFTFPLGTATSKIWETIWRYIHNTYDIESIEIVYVAGDGAPWIKAGAEYLPNAQFVLDRFHLQKAILKIAGQDKDKLKQLNKSIWTNKRSEAIKLFQELYIDAASKTRQNTLVRNYKYIINNWNGIQAYKTADGEQISCSAEGHVSHILSARLSSRPMGWTKHGANQIAHLRVHKANGVDLKKLYAKHEKARQKATNISVPTSHLNKLKKAVGASNELCGNMPSLRNKNSSLTRVLRGIRAKNIFTL